MTPVSNYLIVGAALFALGLIGFLTPRNLILMFLFAELMLQGVALNFVAFSRLHGNLSGQVFTLFVITVAACEAALALALILMLYHRRPSLEQGTQEIERLRRERDGTAGPPHLAAVLVEDVLVELQRLGAPTRQR